MFEEDLINLEKQHLLRTIRDRAGGQGRTVIIEGKEVINFASNDYLGLAADPRLAEAAKRALDAYGAGSGASRLLSGGTELHRSLEREIAAFKGTDDAVLFNSGYAANTGAIPALAAEGDAIFSDELNHASIIDGCRLSRATVHIYRHKDMSHLEELLNSPLKGKRFVVTDTIFSMDGDLAPIKDLSVLCEQYGAILYLDDAHGTGVLGNGRGALAHCGLKPAPRTIQMSTFGKALGVQGAAVCGASNVITWLLNRARSLVYSTALPAHNAAAALEALQIVRTDTALIDRLWENTKQLMEGLEQLGLNTGTTNTPIIPVFIGDAEKTVAFSQVLFDRGVYAPAIRPPTVPGPRLRVSVTAGHTSNDIQTLLSLLELLKN